MNEFATPNDSDTFECEVDSGTKDGTYKAECIGLERKTSKQGNPMWVWNFQIETGVRIYMYTVISPAGAWKLAQVATALGLPQKEGKIKCGISDIIGRDCMVEVVNDDSHDGTPRPQIDKLAPIPKDDGDAIPF
jgi:hypothetical protein